MYVVKVSHWSHFGSGGLTDTLTLITKDFKKALALARNIENDSRFDFGDHLGGVYIYDLTVDERYEEKNFNWYVDLDEMTENVVLIRPHGLSGKWHEQWSEEALRKHEIFEVFSKTLKDVSDEILSGMLHLDKIRRWRMRPKTCDAVNKESERRKLNLPSPA